MLVDGVDLRQVAPDTRRSRIRMVPQDGFLFDTTVRENVRMGRPGASDRDVETAFEELGLGDWVASMPEGIDTHVGERGEAPLVGWGLDMSAQRQTKIGEWKGLETIRMRIIQV